MWCRRRRHVVLEVLEEAQEVEEGVLEEQGLLVSPAEGEMVVGDQEQGGHLPLNLGDHHLGMAASVDQQAAVVHLVIPQARGSKGHF